jgi:hypothetical protein
MPQWLQAIPGGSNAFKRGEGKTKKLRTHFARVELRSQFRRTIKAPSSGRIGFYDQDSANSERGNAIEVSKRASSGRGSDPKIGQSDPYDPQRSGVRKRGGEGRSASLLHSWFVQRGNGLILRTLSPNFALTPKLQHYRPHEPQSSAACRLRSSNRRRVASDLERVRG